MLRALFVLVCCMLCLTGKSQQDSTRPFTAGMKVGYGFVIPHSPIIHFLANRHIVQNEAFFEKKTRGNKAWHARFQHPSLGILFSRFDLKNEQHIGQTYSLSPYMKFKLAGGSKVNLQLRTAIGLGYIEKPFQQNENFKNTAIGSHINLFISLLLEGKVALYKGLDFTGGINLSHFSNTGYQTPNLGFNILTVNSGLNYHFGKTQAIRTDVKESFTPQKAYWQISSGIGWNEINPPNGEKYVAKALFIAREKRLNPKSTLGGGVDFFYNPAHRVALANDSTSISELEIVQVALSMSHILHFGRLSFTGQLSYYLKSEYKELGNIYHIFGGRWAINEQFNAFFLGKTHIDKAEYVMFGMGMKLGYEKK